MEDNDIYRIQKYNINVYEIFDDDFIFLGFFYPTYIYTIISILI